MMGPSAGSALLLGFSILVYAMASHFYHHEGGLLAAPILSSARRRLPYPLFWSGIQHVVRFLYYVGLPYLALRQGIIPANVMGVGEWTATEADVLKAVGLMLATLVVVALTWRSYAGSLARFGDRLPLDGRGAQPLPAGLDAIYLDVHWAFYRSVAILWAGGDYYTGTWVGVVLVILEDLLNPRTRRALAAADAGMDVLIRWGMALSVGVAFLSTHSLWLVAALHWLVELGSAAVRRRLAGGDPPEGEQATS